MQIVAGYFLESSLWQYGKRLPATKAYRNSYIEKMREYFIPFFPRGKGIWIIKEEKNGCNSNLAF